MRAITLFEAYQNCQTMKSMFEDCRGKRFGIGVNNDYYALRWQRYDRLEQKLEKRLLAILSRFDTTMANSK